MTRKIKGVVLEYLGFGGYTPSGKAKHKWKLQCDCGQIYEGTSKVLLDSNSRSCGCLKRKDLTGKTVNGITVLEYKYTRRTKNSSGHSYGTPMYLCRCFCGNEWVGNAGAMIRRKTKGCGCKNRSHELTYIKDVLPLMFWTKIVNSAKKRKMLLTITPEYLVDIWIKQDGRCKFTGEKLYFGKNSEEFSTGSSASVDRIDSSIGYVEGNVQWVHKHINFMKLSKTDKEFVEWCQKVSDFTNSKYQG